MGLNNVLKMSDCGDSVSLASVETPRTLAVLSLLRSARKAVSTVAALEYLQAVGAFPAMLGAHLSLLQNRFADFGPKVTGAAESL